MSTDEVTIRDLRNHGGDVVDRAARHAPAELLGWIEVSALALARQIPWSGPSSSGNHQPCSQWITRGSIFVVTLVMGDFITVRFMSGGQSASVGRIISNEIGLLQYPAAAASAVVLLITVLIMIAIMMRFVDIRKEL